MEVEFESSDLLKLASDHLYDGGFDKSVLRSYRMRIQQISAAADERDFYALKSLHFEKLKGQRQNEYSMRLNDQWRLIVKFKKKGAEKVVVVCAICDYH